MPKLERLEWLVPMSEGRGVTLSTDPEADLFLAQNPLALILGVLYDSQLATRQAFTAPLRLRERLGHFDIVLLAGDDITPLAEAFCQKPALHRFPNKFAQLTQKFAVTIISEYGGDVSRIWLEAGDVESLGLRILGLPAFGVEKANWTIGMLGRLGMLPFSGWEDYKVVPPRKSSVRKPVSL